MGRADQNREWKQEVHQLSQKCVQQSGYVCTSWPSCSVTDDIHLSPGFQGRSTHIMPIVVR
jgi:hypothetical protein